MPLETGKSKKAFSHNVEVEVEAGKPQKQAVAISYSERRRGSDADPEIELREAIEAGEEETEAEQAAARAGAREGRAQRAALRELEVDCSEDEADCSIEMDDEPDDLPKATAADAAPVVPTGTATNEQPKLMALDRGSLRVKDANGFMHVRDCRISKANVCPYLGREIPGGAELGLDADHIYNLYRDPAALAAAAPTFERVPLMMHHVGVSAENPQKPFVIGAISNVRWQAPYLVADLTVWDSKGIEAIESERQQELSPGYWYRPEMNSGVIDGQPYDGRMLDIKANHLAIVDTGRTGPDVVVNDRKLQAA